MTVHIILMTLILLYGLLFYSNGTVFPHYSRSANRGFVVASELTIFLIVGLRASTVGIDTSNYELFFYKVAENADYVKKLDWEILFRILLGASEKMNSFQMLLVFCAAINCIGFGHFAISVTEDDASAFWYIFYFVTLGSYFNSMNLLRQFCAMSVTINIYAVLRKDQSKKAYLKAIFLFLIGLGFHASAVLTAIYFVPFLLKTVDRRTICVLSSLALTGIVAYRAVIFYILNFWSRYAKYEQDNRLTSGRTGIFAISMILLRIVMIIVVLTMDPEKPENRDIYRQTVYTIVSTALFMLQSQTQFALRIGYYYEVLFPLFVPSLIRRIKNRRSRMILYVLIAVYAFMYYFYMMKWGGTMSNRATVPYTFFWAE